MKTPEYMKYKCSRCGQEITDSDDVLVISVLLKEKEVFDLCNCCKKDFKDFMKALKTKV